MRSWAVGCLTMLATNAFAQAIPAPRLAILQAEDRRAPDARDVAAIRSGARAADADTVRIAVRALGRLERPALIPDILPALRHSRPEVRAEAANAIAQAAQGLGVRSTSRNAVPIATAQGALIARLSLEGEPSVRAAMCEAVARLPYRSAADVERAETALLEVAGRHTTVTDRLGVIKGIEALVRLHRELRPPGGAAVAFMRELLTASPARSDAELVRDARLRRLALEALIQADVADDDAVVEHSANDPDAQVRRLAMRAAARTGRSTAHVAQGLADPAPMVRIEALQTLRRRHAEAACLASLKATLDPETSVALVGFDQLAECGASTDVVALLEQTAADPGRGDAPRGWHRRAHALVALAAAAPDRARPLLAGFAASLNPYLRLYAARAAVQLADRPALDTLARDRADGVANVALAALGSSARQSRASGTPTAGPLAAADLRRLAAPRARITVRGVGRFDLALFTGEAPATVLRFAALAESGYYNGLAFDRLVPNSLAQGGAAPAANAGAGVMRDEVGLWPHVRGAVGIATHGRDTGDAQIFIDLVDNPQFDHEYTVFGQVLNGIDVVDRLLEGDVIESVEVIP